LTTKENLMTTMTETELTMYEGVSDSIARAIAKATPAQLAAPSPCVGWSSRDVLNHMIGGADLFAACARGEQQPFPDWSDMPDWVGQDPSASYRRAAAGVLTAFSAPRVLEGTVPMPWGDTPAPFALNLIMADHATHAWDLTRATGLTIEIPAATAETALATTQVSVSPEFRAAGLYADEQPVPEGASTLDRLAAFSGRSL
jgi:uncharacterized protein (TIGR03086 family)